MYSSVFSRYSQLIQFKKYLCRNVEKRMIKRSIPAVLVVEDGTVFFGKAVGAIGTTTGELAFNTAMTGYQEVFSDPSYFGQIVVMTTPHIGNYGIHLQETESDLVMISGLVTHNFSPYFSRPAASDSLENALRTNGKVGISEIDTRALVRHVRNHGSMNAIISSQSLDIVSLGEQLRAVPSMNGLELSSAVSTKVAYEVKPQKIKYRVSVVDFGIKKNIIRCLVDRGIHVKIFPMNSSLSELNSFSPDGYFLSNGPGDPQAMPQSIALVKEIIDSMRPVFGICLGHQLIGLSQGLKTHKMLYGHRGINHPVKNLRTNRAEITSQNHGFVIDKNSLVDHPLVQLTHIHLNDHSVAGIALRERPVFSVQYHPESSAGPHDSRYLFDQFISLLEQKYE